MNTPLVSLLLICFEFLYHGGSAIQTIACQENEEYQECGSGCPLTCKNYKESMFCTQHCRQGCFCKYGYVRGPDNKCILPVNCPIGPCGDNEVASTCVSPCNDCFQKGNCYYGECKRGCDCKPGYHRNSSGQCVIATACESAESMCEANEHYVQCVNLCNDCWSRGHCDDDYCEPGCDCKPGYFRDDNGLCVPENQCIQFGSGCGENEFYSECANPCNDCERKGHCRYTCQYGCDCKYGFYRNRRGVCVPRSQCPTDNGITTKYICKGNEEYYDCVPQCNSTCENYNKPEQYCSTTCNPGCFCKRGFVKNSLGACVSPSECPTKCGLYEEYTECGSACQPTCKTLGKSIMCTLQCVKGCVCVTGYVRNDDDGKCVKPYDCPVECGKNEEYSYCGSPCPQTCSNYGKTLQCGQYCVKGCFCKPGFVKNAEGQCVLPSACPKVCGLYEEYQECGTPCPVHCANQTSPSTIPCPKICVQGCFCSEGYVRGPDGTCILPNKCPIVCGENEIYQECGNSCEPSCLDPSTATLQCNTSCKNGCFCKPGYVRGPDGKCILPTYCPQKCGIYEEYRECGTACPRHCSNLTATLTAACAAVCVKGCFCQEGYVRGPNGTCILPASCPVECGIYEEYRECGTACPRHCSNLTATLTAACTARCVKGCFCQEGYVRGPNGTCILPASCPVVPEECGVYEEYRECGTACPQFCSNFTNPSVSPCPTICVKGCFCQDGYVRGPNGTCILNTSCPIVPEECGLYEEYRECGTACPQHCSNLTNPSIRPCPTVCVKGCFCQEGYVRGPDGACILPSKCPVVCSRKEVYKECGSACPPTCADRNKTCAEVCVRGCFCKKRYVRHESGKCILPRNCPLNCKENEVYMKCGPRCEPSCSTPQRSAALCPACRKGCFCKPGYVRGPRRKCILYKECPIECKENEEFKECGTACPANCTNQTPTCIEQCVRGCFCKPGYIKDQDGKCILPSTCPQICNENEEFKECGTACPPNCTNRNPRCPRQCVKGCFCKPGYIKDRDGKCILPSECPMVCGENEEFKECGPKCIATCENYLRLDPCPPPCVAGCFCKPGYVKGPDGKCILPDFCPKPECPENESFKRCGPACQLTCSNIGKSVFCQLKCTQGCFCNDGYVRGPRGKCIRREMCQIGCRPFEEYKCSHPSCEGTCSNALLSSPRCPIQCTNGCYCKEGLVRGPNNNCIPPTMCPRKCLLTFCSGIGGRGRESNTTDIDDEEEEDGTTLAYREGSKITSYDITTPKLIATSTSDNGSSTISKELDKTIATEAATEKIESTKSTSVPTSSAKEDDKKSTPQPTTPSAVKTDPVYSTKPQVKDKTTLPPVAEISVPVPITTININYKSTKITTPLLAENTVPITTTLMSNKETTASSAAATPVTTRMYSDPPTTAGKDKTAASQLTNKATDAPTTLSIDKPTTAGATKMASDYTEKVTKNTRQDITENMTTVSYDKNSTLADPATTKTKVHVVDGLKTNSRNSKSQKQKSRGAKTSTRAKPKSGKSRIKSNPVRDRKANSKKTRRPKPNQANRTRGNSKKAKN